MSSIEINSVNTQAGVRYVTTAYLTAACSRCRAYYEEEMEANNIGNVINEDFQLKETLKFAIVSMNRGKTSTPPRPVALCHECTKDLLAWLKTFGPAAAAYREEKKG